jgi:hypothetical protein
LCDYAHADEAPQSWNENYPLREAQLARSVPYVGNVRRLHEIMRQAAAGEKLNVVVLGGSVTLGHYVDEPTSTWSVKGWVARLDVWLKHRFPNTELSVLNRARSGCWSQCQSSVLFETLPPDELIHIVIVDTSINDAWLHCTSC